MRGRVWGLCQARVLSQDSGIAQSPGKGFGDKAVIRLEDGPKQGSKSKGLMAGLEEAIHGVYKSPEKMLTQWRTNED